MALALVLASLIVAVGCFVAYQLVLQNGRILLRLEALEDQQLARAASPGLPLGSVVHDFDLAQLGGGRAVLSQWLGRRVLLIFFDPSCGFSRAMLPRLAALSSDPSLDRPMPVVVTTGDYEENARLMGEHNVRCPVLLQDDREVASLYRVDGTPMGYLIDEQGRTASALALGEEALLRLAAGAEPAPAARVATVIADNDGQLVTRAPVRSRLNRSGLVAGTSAPDFRLPRLDAGDASLRDYRGRRVLLVFSDPNCGPCDALAPRLEQINRRTSDLQVVVISRGDLDANRAKVREHSLTFPILLQRHWEISRDYAMFATPIAYLIDQNGVIAAPVAIGAEAIVNLASPAADGVGKASKEVVLQR